MHLQFKVTLKYTKPPVWRRFTLDEDATFEDLHDAIQDAFGWKRCHLWDFRYTDRPANVIADMGGEFGEGRPAHLVPLRSYFTLERSSGKKALYTYDYGDNWEHEVLLEKEVEPEEPGLRYLIGGRRTAPPEDCGGIPGFERVTAIKETGEDPWGEDPGEILAWLEGWEPEPFSLASYKPRFDRAGASSSAPLEGEAQRVLELIEQALTARGASREYVELAQGCWRSYHAEHGVGRRQAKTHAACVDYATALWMDAALTQREIAEQYGVSTPTISNSYRDYTAHVGRRAPAPPAPGDDPRALFEMARALPVHSEGWFIDIHTSDDGSVVYACMQGDGVLRLTASPPAGALVSLDELAHNFLFPMMLEPFDGDICRPPFVMVEDDELRERIRPLLEALEIVVQDGVEIEELDEVPPEWLPEAPLEALLEALQRCMEAIAEVGGEINGFAQFDTGDALTGGLVLSPPTASWPMFSLFEGWILDEGTSRLLSIEALDEPEHDWFADARRRVGWSHPEAPTIIAARTLRGAQAPLEPDDVLRMLLSLEAYTQCLRRLGRLGAADPWPPVVGHASVELPRAMAVSVSAPFDDGPQ